MALTERSRRLLWFAAIWALSVLALAAVSYPLPLLLGLH
jgi:hypothetical protein